MRKKPDTKSNKNKGKIETLYDDSDFIIYETLIHRKSV
jgi:hypothetical protein